MIIMIGRGGGGGNESFIGSLIPFCCVAFLDKFLFTFNYDEVVLKEEQKKSVPHPWMFNGRISITGSTGGKCERFI